ncbi:OLC1v1028414C1 [Oldenlandia corymbosa var. corymbosa]|uniref:OLC1v1028414C1 n=1 Tax=Oldenlandia corymbosa var. corymbosa TaxID=529605 RepID=A0AAV1CEQ0_OLDCO|nr:OLC1v1028414C1 [Oldenlandia corymbosa var. corymbosa]
MKLCRTLLFSCSYNKKALAFGLWLIWLFGIFFICASFYATQMLSFSTKDNFKKPRFFGHGVTYSIDPTVTIFTAPKGFVGSVGERQEVAVRSWLGLSSSINVVLFSQDSSAVSFASAFGSRVSVESNIDFSFLGSPFFHSMVARSQASASDISVMIDPEMVLFPDFFSTLKYAGKLDHDWLLVASSPNVTHLSFMWDADGKKVKYEKGFLARKLQWEHCDRRMLLAWNNGDVPLHNGVIPPFLYGKGIHNQWIVTEALSSDYRFVFDVSWTVSSTFVSDPNQEYYQLKEASTDSGTEKINWEFTGNVHLGKLYGSFSFRGANFSNLFRFSKCDGHYIFTNREQDIVYPLGGRVSFSLRDRAISTTRNGKKILDCVDALKSDEGIENCSVKDRLPWSSSLSLPHSFEQLLSMRADLNRTIVLALAGYSYKDLLMSWVCRLRRLKVSNFLVGAIDHEIYEFSILQGLPVFAYEAAPTNISFDDCHFGTECFQKVTKVKSRVVLQILKLGYNVLMSDVDVYWFKNPLPFLSSFGPAILVAQSDEFKTTGPINLPRRLNSGFYYVNSDSQTIAALQKVVEHALVSNLSEQPSFYDVLCGEGGSYRIGDNRCLEPETNVSVQFLERDLFPNGAYKDLWLEKSVKDVCREKGCFVIHNNWSSGRRKKLERQVSSGLWEYDMNTRMCVQQWHKIRLTSYF